MDKAPQLDQVAKDLAGRVSGSLQRREGATFQGYLGEGHKNNSYRLFLTPSFDVWLELDGTDILSQIHGNGTANGASVVWVRSGAQIVKCHAAPARKHADYIAEDAAEGNAAGYVPKW